MVVSDEVRSVWSEVTSHEAALETATSAAAEAMAANFMVLTESGVELAAWSADRKIGNELPLRLCPRRQHGSLESSCLSAASGPPACLPEDQTLIGRPGRWRAERELCPCDKQAGSEHTENKYNF